jgi:dTDP-glucose 4,6-dehydratase
MRKRVLITGGCGFIGSNLVRYILRERPEWSVTNLDALTYAGDTRSLASIAENPGYRFIHGSVCDRRCVVRALEGVDTVIHLAAESHVDRSIVGPDVFIRTNVIGSQVVARCAAAAGVGVFLHVSTDEVYGSCVGGEGVREDAALSPSSPYAASKAAAEGVIRSAAACWGLRAIITRPTNNYGPWQHPEKMIPRFITNAVRGIQLPMYGDGAYLRDWMLVEEHCRAMVDLVERGAIGETYNIGSGQQIMNMNAAKLILEVLGEEDSLIEHVGDRLGHDRGYAIDVSKIERAIGWSARRPWTEGLQSTIGWYLTHGDWWRELVERH